MLSPGMQKAIPQAYWPGTCRSCTTTVGLLHSWQDPLTGILYPIGTRFVHEPSLDTFHEYGIRFNNYKKKCSCTARIARTKACLHCARSLPESRTLFMKILKEWCYLPDGFMPYVWGGTSGDTLYFLNQNDLTRTWGLDCSGLILRAAQLAGAPYFYRNTFTLSHYLKPLGEKDTLKEGDLLFHKGHVMIVSSLKNNMLIEAAGLPTTGWGRVHEIPLNAVFKDISSFDQLVAAYRSSEKLALQRLHKEGHVYRTIDAIIFLRFASIFDLYK
jgi:hypothetical protein